MPGIFQINNLYNINNNVKFKTELMNLYIYDNLNKDVLVILIKTTTPWRNFNWHHEQIYTSGANQAQKTPWITQGIIYCSQ